MGGVVNANNFTTGRKTYDGTSRKHILQTKRNIGKVEIKRPTKCEVRDFLPEVEYFDTVKIKNNGEKSEDSPDGPIIRDLSSSVETKMDESTEKSQEGGDD